MADLTNRRIKDTYDGVLHASGSSLTLGDGSSTNTIDANFNTVDVPVGGLQEGGVSHTSVSATTDEAGHVELATDTEAHAATDTTRAVTPSNLLIKKDGTAIVAGDLTGDSRGDEALDVQAGRNFSTQVASGASSSAVGYDNRALGDKSSAFGYYNNANQPRSSAFGYSNETLGEKSSAFGYQNAATGGNSSAFGYSNTAGGSGSSVVGNSNAGSGLSCVAFGNSNSASSMYSSAVGYSNSAFAENASSFGNSNTASGDKSSVFGYQSVASGSGSSVVGYNSFASGDKSSAFGHYSKTTVNNTFEAGYWSNATTRGGAIRMHPNGQVAMTIEDSASIPGDGGATAGSETDGTLPSGMFTIQKYGNAVTLYYNNGVSIQSLSLGTLS
jgi:hypothetical protein